MAAMIWTFAREGAVSGKEVNKMAKDPICGMEMHERKALAKYRHMRKTYYFCAPREKK